MIRRNQWRSIIINGTLLFSSTVIALCLGEVLLRIYEPVEMRLQGNEIKLTTNRTQIIQNDKIAKLDPVIKQTRNSIGFRGENPPLNFDKTLTILAVGGSTTECYYLSDGHTWPEILGEKLKKLFEPVWINNAGLDGHSTYGHTYLMRDYIAAIRPKVVTFLIGVNDIGLSKSSPYDDYFSKTVEYWRTQAKSRPSLWNAIRNRHQIIDTLAHYSHIVNLALNIGRSLIATTGGMGHGQVDFKAVSPLRMSSEEVERDLEKQKSEFLPLYKERVTKLIQLTRSLGIEPVLMTQPAMWGYGIDPATGIDLGPVSGFFWDRMELYNDVTRTVGKEYKVPVVDLAKKVPKDSRLYYDWFHFTSLGAEKVAEIVASELKPILSEKYPGYLRSP